MIQPKHEAWAAEGWPKLAKAQVRLLRLSELAVADHLAWAALSRAASQDSIYASHWFTQSVLAHHDAGRHYGLLVVGAPDGSWDGVLVIRRIAALGRLPFRHFANLLDANQFSGVPLVRPGCETRFWESLFAALDAQPLGCNALRLAEMPEEHRATRALLALCGAQSRPVERLASKARALWQPATGAAETAFAHLSAKRRGRLQGLERKLAESHGPIELQQVAEASELDQWLSEFLALELAGWKGKKGSALASDGRTAQHFRHVAHTGFADGSFKALALRANGRPIAMTSYFLAGQNGFGFKMAYDENYACFAPGILLIRQMMALHQNISGLRFDSCSPPDAGMINELWPDRHRISDYIIAIGDFPSRGRFVAAMAARKFWHRIKLWRPVAAIASSLRA